MGKKVCYPWSRNWAKAMPDPIVKKAVEKGLISADCLPEDRKVRLGLIGEEAVKEVEQIEIEK